MQEDNTYENTNIDEALTAMVDAFSRVAIDLNTLQHGMIAHLNPYTKRQLLAKIVRAFHIVDSDSFTVIRDSIEMEYDRRIGDGKMTDEFYKSIKSTMSIVGNNNIMQINSKTNNDSVDMGGSQ